MQCTLKDAHRFENALARAVEQIHGRIRSESSLTVSAYSADIQRDIERQQALVDSLIAEAHQLILIRYRVRREIQEANERHGISAMLNAEASAQARIRVLEQALAQQERIRVRPIEMTRSDALRAEEVETIRTKFASVRANPGSAVSREDSVELPTVLNETMLERYQTLVLRYKREVEQTKDRVGGLNINTTIRISLEDDERTLLRKHNIAYGAEG